MAEPQAGPKPTHIERVSPSLAEELRGCELRVAFRGDARFAALRRPRPAAALGVVVHDLSERVARGEFDALSSTDAGEALAAAWEAGVAEQAKRLQEAWRPGIPPEPTRWPGYALARVRCLRRLNEQLAHVGASPGRGQAASTSAEVWVEAPGEPIGGRIDRVEETPAGTQIVDIKSGWTVSDELRPSHRRQLLIYAYLWHAAHGEWPIAASIQRLDGSRITIDVVPAEAIAAAQEALTLLRQYNEQVKSGVSASELARPGSDSCLHCDFKVACDPFISALTPDWQWYRKAIAGQITSSHGDEQRVIEITVSHSNLDLNGSTARLIGLPASLAGAPGSTLIATDLLPTHDSSEARYAWDSTVRRG
jgi:RecB family exonuclease